MTIIQLIEENLLLFGSPEHPFNKRNLLRILISSVSIISLCTYFFCEAKTFFEYSRSIYAIGAIVDTTLNFGVIVWSLRSFLHCFIEAKQIIDGSEFDFDVSFLFNSDQNSMLNSILGLKYLASKTIYENSDRLTQKTKKIINGFGMTIICPTITVPTLISNFYAQFTSDLGNDGFQLYFPFWLVLNEKKTGFVTRGERNSFFLI